VSGKKLQVKGGISQRRLYRAVNGTPILKHMLPQEEKHYKVFTVMSCDAICITPLLPITSSSESINHKEALIIPNTP
jgi:hypothetical protein